MRLNKNLAKCLTVFVLAATPASAQKRLAASDAKNHIGETATVCGSVISGRYAPSAKGEPTFLNLDEPYPKQVFAILIWRENRSKFGTPERDYKGKHICVTGKITEYRGAPEIVADSPRQIAVE